jgi:hypothetical protein
MPTSRRRTKKKSKPQPKRTAPRIREIMQRGWSRRDAEQLGVIELALDAVPKLGHERGALRVLAEHVGTALLREPVFIGAQAMYADKEHAQTWRMLATYAEEPRKHRLLVLAGLSDGCDVGTVDSDNVVDLVTAEDLNLLEAARVAEAAGEFDRAMDLLRGAVRPLDDPWMTELGLLAQHGDELSPARWGRWICGAAVRYLLGRPVGLDAAQHYAVVALTALGATKEQLAEHALARAHYDQMVHDVVLFDEEGLRSFLDHRLSDEVAARAPGIAAWPDAAPRIVRLDRVLDGGDGLCRDVVTGVDVVVGEHGLTEDFEPGTNFYGRLVQVDGDDRSFFAMKPTITDDLTAARLAIAIRLNVGPERRLIDAHRGLAVTTSETTAEEPPVDRSA